MDAVDQAPFNRSFFQSPAGLPTFLRGEAEPSRAVSVRLKSSRGGHMLSHHERRFLLTQRGGHLATTDSRAIPHVVPVCFTISQGIRYITVDDKPKRVAGAARRRVR